MAGSASRLLPRERTVSAEFVGLFLVFRQPAAGRRHLHLAHCKFSQSGRRNLVEMAEIGDWIVGTGGKSASSAGHGRLIYAMRVTDKIGVGIC